MKVATYTRISTDEARQPFSLSAQSDRLNAYIFSQEGWRLVRTYKDQMSGKTLERPGLQQALREAKQGMYELLLVFKVDRLARSTSGLARFLEELDSAGVAFRSASEPFDTSTAAGRMMVQMLGVFAEFEREMIVERTKMGLAKKASRGEWTGGVAPLGYRYDLERKLLVPVKDETAVVKLIFDRYVNRRWGSMTISNWMNDKYDLTRRGARWTPKKVIEVLRNPTYIGLLPFNGEVYEAGHKGLIPKDLFDQASALLEERGESLAKRAHNSTEYLLSSVVRCRKCCHRFVGTAAHGRGGIYRYYTCWSRQRHGTSRCDQDRIPADLLEEAMLAEVLEVLEDIPGCKKVAANILSDWKETHADSLKEIGRLDRRISNSRKALERYLKAFESGRLPESACASRVREIEKELSVLDAERATLEAGAEPPEFSEDFLGNLRSEIADAMENGSPQRVKRLLSAVVDSIEVESRSFVQPYFNVVPVRTPFPSRRRTGIEPASELSPAHWF